MFASPLSAFFIYTFAAKRPDNRTKLGYVNAKLVTDEHSSKTVQCYNMHKIQKKMKPRNISRSKITVGLSITLSINTMGGWGKDSISQLFSNSSV